MTQVSSYVINFVHDESFLIIYEMFLYNYFEYDLYIIIVLKDGMY